ncbi:MAG: hypothetical protein HND39_07975 [Ignavibacteriota bacterium]|nr:MAG: hypothetical protein EDM72_09535 [Chlorobiota bacterium]MBE7476215.1 hypothetical protein [Ignavibacteriales bacterium]MBL1124497.1 hypothetical protein [Ignavibacteriota bacterium]MCC7094902.1 hypothetical protein [Ignavibacteriaceae bacterium]MCE7857717.1 hypothetical protein [Ignavibacteria bacterium CHB3]MEB2297657.1 hypothetical protein [Ignavibacteria bacterium]
MNSKQKYVILIASILIAAVLIWWLMSGGEVLSKDGVWVEQELSELDKALGLEPQKIFQEKFILGLLPHAAIFSGVVLLASTILFFIFKTKK